MDLQFSTTALIYVLDLIGVASCAAAATLLAKRLNFDVLGAVLVSVVGSVGGGTLRDILLNRHPIFWLVQLEYLSVITSVSLIVQVFFHQLEKRLSRPLRWFDSLGLAAFTVIGVEAALQVGMAMPIVILMGVMTSVVGGILRDVICRQLPLVLRREIYISASIAGGCVYLILMHYLTLAWVAALGAMAVAMSLRMLAVYRGWHLPNISMKRR